MILVAGKYDAHKGPKLGTPSIQALKTIIATGGGSGISVVDAYRVQGSTPAKNPKRFHFLSAVIEAVGKILMREDFNAPEINWA